MLILTLLLLILGPAAHAAELVRQDFLLSFPEIGFDEKQAVFSNSEWSAVFSGKDGAMFTVPYGTPNLPPVSQEGRGCRVVVGNATYVCNPVRGNTIVKQDAYGNTDKTITPANPEAMTAFADAWKKMTVSRADVTEEIGPLCSADTKVWFGLVAFYKSGQMPISGLGWYDAKTDQFGRVYSAALQDMTPRWIGVRQDTVWAFCAATGADVGGKLIYYSIHFGTLGTLDHRAVGIPGDTLLNVALWRGNMLIATNDAICVWPRGENPWVWQTDAYATREGTWLKFLTFDVASGIKNIGDDFFPLQKNRPTQAFAKVGDWLELDAPQGVEAMMPTAKWKALKQKTVSDDWGCGDKLCFARVKVDVSGEKKDMDLLDVPMVPLKEGDTITKLGVRAGWVPVNQVVPVLMKK